MKRLALTLAVAGILCLTAGITQAHDYHHGHGNYYRGHNDVVIVRPPVWANPPVVVRPRVVYPPVYRYRYCEPAPSFGFRYNGPGLSVGVGF
jgi:hypothetical protein